MIFILFEVEEKIRSLAAADTVAAKKERRLVDSQAPL